MSEEQATAAEVEAALASHPLDAEEEIRQGREAQDLFESEAFQRALKRAESDILRAWKSTKPENQEAREACYHEHRALLRLAKTLRATADRGKLRAEELRSREEQRER